MTAQVWRYLQTEKGKVVPCCLIAGLLVWPTVVGAGPRQTSGPPVGHASPFPADASNGMAPANGTDPKKLEHMREEERRKRLLSDTAKLVELSNELHTEVEKTPKDELSMDVVRKAAELEKLAKDVKDRMRN